MHLQVRPIDHWRGEETSPRRGHLFASSYQQTLALLDHELRQIRAEVVALLIDVSERDCKLDGSIRADARPHSPRVVLAFDSKHGPLRYQCDTFHDWRANVRAIALALEALRKVDRYGVGGAGEQYRGWAQLPAATPLGEAVTVESAAAFIAKHAVESPLNGFFVFTADELLADARKRDQAYRIAAKNLHPDAGGDPGEFERLTAARDLLESVS